MSVIATSIAAGNFVGLENKQFAVSAEVLERKILLIGAYDPLLTAVVDNVPVQILSPEDVGDQTGFGFMLHRLAVAAFKKSGGLETWMIPQPDDGAAVIAVGEIDFATSAGVLAGTLPLYIAGISAPVTIIDAMTVEEIADAVVAKITANANLPVTATKTAVTFEVVPQAKGLGLWGNDITIEFLLQPGDVMPSGITAVVTDMAAGTTVPDIQDALDALGTGDAQNEAFFTDVIHGYGQDTDTIDALSTYNGEGNDFVGNYAKTVARPFRCLSGDVAVDAAGLTALLVITADRVSNRTHGIITVEGSPNHPIEIAAEAMALMARTNNIRAEESYIGKELDIFPGDVSERWSADYTERDRAMKLGVTSVIVENGVVKLQNVVSFYHPDTVSLASNAFLSMRNISIIQNLGNSTKLNFSREKWLSITIVADVAKVSSTVSREKVRDIDSVIDDLVALAKAWEGLAWIFTGDFTIEKLAEGGLVTIRAGSNGFDMTVPTLLSGEGGIFNTNVQFDASSAILTA